MRREQLQVLANDALSGRLSRRDLARKAAAMGIAIPAVAGIATRPWMAMPVLAQDGSELIVAAGGDIDTLDPHVSQLLVFANMVRWTVFSSLVKYAPDLSYEGDLAASWENPDPLTYVFTLKAGLTYHDGTPVTAADVEYSFKRIVEKQTVFSSRLTNVAGYEVIDDLTIKITLTAIQADFIDGLIALTIISEAIAANAETAAVGTGPFKLVEWIPNDSIVLEKNATYHEAGVPGVEKLTFKILPEVQTALTNVKSGDVHAVLDVPVSQAAPLKDDADVTPIIVPTSSIHLFEMLGKNHEMIRGNAKVRQALAHCMDKETIKTAVFSGEGFPKWTFVGSTHWAYKDVPGYDYNPAGAAEILAAEGVEGLEFTVLCIQGYPDGEKTATIWQAGLAEAGITMNIEVQELSVWLDNYINHTYDIIWNVFPGFADPNYFVGFGLQPHLADGWTSADAKAAADGAVQTIDQAERAALYGSLQEMFVADLPCIIVQEAPAASVVAKSVAGWEINPLGFIHLDGVTVS